jgi:pyochelin biosynthetic protein PchC
MTAQTGAAWLRRHRPRPDARARIACFPHAGGTAGFFRAWANDPPPAVELLAVQYPGREDRIAEPCIDDAGTLVRAVAGALDDVAAAPLVLFGHSLGAVLAYETARELAARGRSPSALVVSGRPAPCFERGGSAHVSEEAIWADVQRLGGTSREVLEYPELRALLLPMLQSDYRISETYAERPGPRLEIPVLACIGDADPEVTEAEARGWSAVTSGPFALRVFTGDHFYLSAARRELVDAMTRFLA